jgi:hypothetical protein
MRRRLGKWEWNIVNTGGAIIGIYTGVFQWLFVLEIWLTRTEHEDGMEDIKRKDGWIARSGRGFRDEDLRRCLLVHYYSLHCRDLGMV